MVGPASSRHAPFSAPHPRTRKGCFLCALHPSPTRKKTQATTETRSSLFVGSTEKAFQVLHAFDGPKRHMTLADIARASGLDRSATQRLVYTLETLGYLRRIPDTRNYGLTPKVLQFSYNYVRANELIDKASPYLLDISRTLGETTNLQELDGHEIVFVARFPGHHLVNVDIAVGSRLPAYFTASGTAILSRLSDEQRREILAQTRLEAITPYTEINPEKTAGTRPARGGEGLRDHRERDGAGRHLCRGAGHRPSGAGGGRDQYCGADDAVDGGEGRGRVGAACAGGGDFDFEVEVFGVFEVGVRPSSRTPRPLAPPGIRGFGRRNGDP